MSNDQSSWVVYLTRYFIQSLHDHSIIFYGRRQCVKGLNLPVFVPPRFLTSPALRMPAQSLFGPITLRFQVPASLSILSPPHLAALRYNYFESFHFTVYHYFRLLIDVIATLSFYRPYNDHVARCASQSIDKGAENRYGHIGSEASAAVLGMRALAQSHWCTAACWKGGGHTGAVVKDLGKRKYLHLYIFLCLLHPGILELDCKIISFCIFYPGKVSIVNQTR